jgi:hypothetical protein
MQIAIGIFVGYYPADVAGSGDGSNSLYFRPASTDLYRRPGGIAVYHRPAGL